jgi:hypothetical protein
VPLLVAVFALSGCGSKPADPASRAGGEAVPQRVGDAGVSVELPAGWHTTAADDGVVIDPLTRLVIASSPIRHEESGCQVAAYAFGEDAVALVVVEWRRPRAVAPDRPRQFTSRELPMLPPPVIECFAGAGGSVQFVDRGRTFGAYLLAGPRAPDVLVTDARRVLDTLRVEPAHGRRLARNGVSVAVPPGWDGRMLFREPAGSWGVLFQVANFELPSNQGFEPPRKLPPGQEDPIKAMGEDDVLVTVSSDEADGAPAPEPVSLDALRFLPTGAPRVPHGHSLAERSLCFGARCLRIEVDFGGRTPARSLRERVDEVLASIAVEETPGPAGATADDEGPRGCPRPQWPGPWTACAEAEWVRRVAEAGGYRVAGGTGSALVAEGMGRSFYIWTTRAERSAVAIASEAGWRRLAVVDDVALYGDDNLWCFWEAQGFAFWVKEGPTASSVVPSPTELERVVEASGALPPPRR